MQEPDQNLSVSTNQIQEEESTENGLLCHDSSTLVFGKDKVCKEVKAKALESVIVTNRTRLNRQLRALYKEL